MFFTLKKKLKKKPMTRRDPEPPITTYCNNNNNNPLAHKLLTFAATMRAHWRVKLCDFVKP